MSSDHTPAAEKYSTEVKSKYGKLVTEKDPFFAPIISMFEQQRKLNDELADMLAQNFERFTEIQGDVMQALITGKAGDAFGFLSEILQVINSAMLAQPVLSAKMGGYLESVKPMVGEIGREFGAEGFTIEYGVPSGISVAFHFSLKGDSNNQMQATR